ncbi:MAG: NUDIX hydrolase, partial [Thermoplasmata archaeon]
MKSDCTVHRLVADVALFAGGRVLFVKYKDVSRYDRQRGWFLPDDFLRFGEHPTEGAKRIAKEQAGLDRPDIRPVHIETFGHGAWHLFFHHRSDLLGSQKAN